MIGRIALFVLILLSVTIGAALAIYGEVDPCRMLAKDQAMQSNQEGGWPHTLGIDTEPWYRLETSQYSTGECIEQLVGIWSDRILS